MATADPDRTTTCELAGGVLLLTLPDEADIAVPGRLVRGQSTDLALTAAQQAR
ncbi:hypothetical protein [Saccharothrix syringae]|uniref:hypothetical protein n=1 Tax=Saccharothrix syringae TaxID=103733 RepID=UPI001293C196|nr:hypothetical protein [Saccharothrix syringae]